MNEKFQLAAEDAQQAIIFIDCARWLIGDPQFDEPRFISDIEVLSPTAFLVGHAIELGLNAFLRIKSVRGGGSTHKLDRLLNSAVTAGLEVSEKFKTYVNMISPSHSNSQFRYAQHKQEAFISPRDSIPVIRPELIKIRDRVMDIAMNRL